MSQITSASDKGAGRNEEEGVQVTDTAGNQQPQPPSADRKANPSNSSAPCTNEASEQDKSMTMAEAAPLVVTLAGAAFLNVSIRSVVSDHDAC